MKIKSFFEPDYVCSRKIDLIIRIEDKQLSMEAVAMM